MPKLFVFKDSYYYLMELRQSKLSFINKWSPCIIQLLQHQLLVFRSLPDVAQDVALFRINLHSLMVPIRALSHCSRLAPS